MTEHRVPNSLQADSDGSQAFKKQRIHVAFFRGEPLNLVLFLRRPGSQAQFSVALQSQHATGSNLDELCVWISEHLHSELTVEILADRLATSVRTLIRMLRLSQC